MASCGMTTSETLYRTPSHPYRWVGLLALSQAAVALLWWHRGWGWGLLALLLSHALFVVPVFFCRARGCMRRCWRGYPAARRMSG